MRFDIVEEGYLLVQIWYHGFFSGEQSVENLSVVCMCWIRLSLLCTS